MKRREFITLLGGTAAAWPVVARAQQGERIRRIGVLIGATAADMDAQARHTAFLQGLQQLGWIDGRNVRIDTRWTAVANADDVRKLTAELVALAACRTHEINGQIWKQMESTSAFSATKFLLAAISILLFHFSVKSDRLLGTALFPMAPGIATPPCRPPASKATRPGAVTSFDE